MCYTSIDVVALTAEQTRLIGQLCGASPPSIISHPSAAPEPPAPAPPTLSQNLRSLHSNETTSDPIILRQSSQVVIAEYAWKQWGGAIIGCPMILMIWLIVARLLHNAGRTPTRIEERKRFGLRRFVVTQYQARDIDGWFAGIMIAMACIYTFTVYFKVIT